MPAPLASIDIEPRTLPLLQPLQTARGPIDRREVFVVRLRDMDGFVGIGEAAPLPQAGTEGLRATERALNAAREALEAGFVQPADDGSWESALLGALDGSPAARFGVDLALWDLAARRAELPLARLLDRESSTKVPVNALLGSKAASDAADALAAGFETLKLKVGARSLQEDAERIQEVAGLAAGRARLRLDANGAWPRATDAVRAWGHLGSEHVSTLEQPVPAADRSGLRWLRSRLPVAVAADEAVIDEATGLQIIESGGADLLVLKPMRLGGLGPCRRLARRAREAGLDVFVTTCLEGAIGRAGTLHLAAALHRAGGPAHGLATGGLLADDLAQGAEPAGGFMAIDPQSPGHGVTA